MDTMKYDHNRKAGNEGDIVKHVALIASINSIASSILNKRFRYVDTFSGYAFNPILPENEWKNGIGKIITKIHKITDPNVMLYFKRYVASLTLPGGTYPGSSIIALDTILHNQLEAEMTLCDISPKVISNLKLAHKKNNCVIIGKPAVPIGDEIINSDLLFIDPPGLFSESKKDYPYLQDLIDFKNTKNNILIWLPVITTEDNPTRSCTDLLRKNGYEVSKVTWAKEKKVIGCYLSYKLPKTASKALKSAIADMSSLADWGKTIDIPVKHLKPINK